MFSNKFSIQDIAHFNTEIEARMVMSATDRQSLPIHHLVRAFKTMADQHTPAIYPDLAEKIKMLSEEKINYYHSSRFGFLIEFFSSLRNLVMAGAYMSSGQLGLKLTEQFLKSSPMNVKDVLSYIDQQKGNPQKG